MESGGILIVEDERIIALDLRGKVARLGYNVAGVAHNGSDAVKLALKACPELVLMDIMLEEDMDGIECVRIIRETNGIPVVFVSASTDPCTKERALAVGDASFVCKPVDTRELAERIEEALVGRGNA